MEIKKNRAIDIPNDGKGEITVQSNIQKRFQTFSKAKTRFSAPKIYNIHQESQQQLKPNLDPPKIKLRIKLKIEPEKGSRPDQLTATRRG